MNFKVFSSLVDVTTAVCTSVNPVHSQMLLTAQVSLYLSCDIFLLTSMMSERDDKQKPYCQVIEILQTNTSKTLLFSV